jgi:cytochrome P450
LVVSESNAVSVDRDDRKTAAFAESQRHLAKGSATLTRFPDLREILRSSYAVQGMDGAEEFGALEEDQVSVFYLDGEPHRRRRTAISRYFALKTIKTRYNDVMEKTSIGLMNDLQRTGSAVLDQISFQMAVDVAADVVGLTNSDSKGLAIRLRKVLDAGTAAYERGSSRHFAKLKVLAYTWLFYWKDLRPALKARERELGDDVLSQMVKDKFKLGTILRECLVYAMAGMVTTRELIVVAAWHLLEKDELRQRYLAGDEDEQLAIVDEILRLEPVAGMIYRIVRENEAPAESPACPGLVGLDLRAANVDESVTGPCPFALDPDRAKRMKVAGNYMSFGDGPHRCPGAQLALHETRVFLDKLLRLPGIRLSKLPTMGWNTSIMGYELRGGEVSCDRIAAG